MTEIFVKRGIPVTKVIKVCQLASSTWYSRIKGYIPKTKGKRGRPIPGFSINPDGSKVLDPEIVKALGTYRAKPEFANAGGYTKLSRYLRRDYGYHVNRKKLYRICDEQKLLLPRNRKKIKGYRKLCENRVITAPNMLWQFDIKYGYIHGENRYFFLLAFIDVFYRKVVGYHIGLSCKAGDLVFTLDRALKVAEVHDLDGLAIRSDNGPQMTSNMMRDYLSGIEINLTHEFTPPATPNKNAFIESFFSIIEVEFLQTRYFKTYGDAYSQTVAFIDFYPKERIHGSLNMMTPEEAEYAFKAGTLKIKKISI